MIPLARKKKKIIKFKSINDKIAFFICIMI